jgi:hypothetical protein
MLNEKEISLIAVAVVVVVMLIVIIVLQLRQQTTETVCPEQTPLTCPEQTTKDLETCSEYNTQKDQCESNGCSFVEYEKGVGCRLASDNQLSSRGPFSCAYYTENNGGKTACNMRDGCEWDDQTNICNGYQHNTDLLCGWAETELDCNAHQYRVNGVLLEDTESYNRCKWFDNIPPPIPSECIPKK